MKYKQLSIFFLGLASLVAVSVIHGCGDKKPAPVPVANDTTKVAPKTIALSGDYHLNGTIADAQVKWMKINVADGIVKGTMYYASQDNAKMVLEGRVDSLGKIVMTEKSSADKETGRLEGTFDGEQFNGTYTLLAKNETSPFLLKKLTSEEIEALENATAGLTFRTFTEQTKDDHFGKVQSCVGGEKIVKNLKNLGFSLSNSKKEWRVDYTGEEHYEAKIDTYSKTVNDRVTTVKLEEDYTEIHFPNTRDVDEFKETVKKCGMKASKEGFVDPTECYYNGTDVTVKGTVVTLHYRWEP